MKQATLCASNATPADTKSARQWCVSICRTISDTGANRRVRMPSMVLLCRVAVTASQAAGRIISSDDDGPGDLAIITSSWDFATVGGQALDCPAGFDTVEVVATGPENITDLY